MFKHILVPTDGSTRSARAAAFASRLAHAHRARITALHVIAPFAPAAYLDGVAPYPELYSAKAYERACEANAARLLGRVARRAAAAKVRCETVHVYADSPWRAITKAARSRGCDLIVMASHGRAGLGALILGSETTKVLTHSKTPVLVTR